jgi:hypothetical protein
VVYVRENVFEWASLWRKVVYKLVIVNGVECIVADGRKEVTYYDPLEIGNLHKRPKYPEGNENSPAMALARLDVEDRNEIIKFVNKFGLLGLWFHPNYSEANGLEEIGESSFMDNTRYSNWYRHPKKSGIYAWMEPLMLFKKAAHDFQQFLESVTAVEEREEPDPERIYSIPVELHWREQLKSIHPAPVWKGNKWEWGWEYRSLLSALYLKVFINKKAGKVIRRCIRRGCGKFFETDHPEKGPCSDSCKGAYHTANSKNRKYKQELIKKYGNQFDSDVLASFIDNLLEKGVSGKRRIEKKIQIELKNNATNLIRL